jgi:hypothetical protein
MFAIARLAPFFTIDGVLVSAHDGRLPYLQKDNFQPAMCLNKKYSPGAAVPNVLPNHRHGFRIEHDVRGCTFRVAVWVLQALEVKRESNGGCRCLDLISAG